MVTAEDGVGDLPIYDLDPKFAGFKDHFSYRMKMYLEQKHLIEKYEGGLEEFSKGYLKFDINTENDATVYREWVPCLFFSSGWTQQVPSLHGRGGHRSGTR